MSIIEVKGTRSEATETKSARRYESDIDGKGSMSPYIIGLSLTMLLLYWKSAFDSWAEAAQPPKQDAPADDQTAPNDDSIAAEGSSGVGEAETTLPQQVYEAPEYASFAISRKAPLGASTLLSSDGSIPSSIGSLDQFAPLEVRNMISRGTAVGFSVFSANDNGLTGYTASVGAGTSGRVQTTDELFAEDEDELDDEDQQSKVVNRQPFVNAAVQLRNQFFSLSAVVGMSDLLQGATDPNGDALSITDMRASSGELVLTANGYEFIAAEPGTVTFSYTVTDGELSIAQTAIINIIEKPMILGTDGEDNLEGDAVADHIEAGAGDDAINGGDNNDVISGGDGDDVIHGGDGNDFIMGGDGDDLIFGGKGDDIILGGRGNDEIFGEEGDDLIDAGDGDDIASDGAGGDSLTMGDGDDTTNTVSDGESDVLDGSTGSDTISYANSSVAVTIDLNNGTAVSDGPASNGSGLESDLISNYETIVATEHNDTIIAKIETSSESQPQYFTEVSANPESHVVEQEEDADLGSPEVTSSQVVASEPVTTESGSSPVPLTTAEPAEPNEAVSQAEVPAEESASGQVEGETYIGGGGIDKLSYEVAEKTITVDVDAGTATGEEIGTDTFSEIEIIETGSGDDMIFGGSSDDMIIGGDGNDAILGGSGDDILEAGSGDDHVSDGEGDDVVDAGAGDDTVETESDGSSDSLDGGDGVDTISFAESEVGVTIDVSQGTATSEPATEAPAEVDEISNFEIFEGSDYNDTFVALSYESVALEDTVAPLLDASTDGAELVAEHPDCEASDNQSFNGGDGDDELDYSAAEETITIDIAEGTASGEEIGEDSFEEIETIETGSGDDLIIAAADLTATTEEIEAAEEDQTIFGGAGEDTLSYENAEEDITINVAEGTAEGEEIGEDSFESIEVLIGGSGDDTFEASELSYNLVSLEETATPDTGLVAEGAIDLSSPAIEQPELTEEDIEVLEDAVIAALAEFTEAAPEDTLPVPEEAPVEDNPVPVDHTYDGGAGFDTLCFANSADDLLIQVSNGEGAASGTSIGDDRFSNMESIVTGEGRDTIIVGAGTISLDGRGGDDMFVFLEDSAITRETRSDTYIKNFEVGDVVRISQWDLFEDAFEKIEDKFEDIYGNSGSGFGDDDIPIRVRHELFEDLYQTFIDADLDRDTYFEISIKLDGHHDLIITSNQRTMPENDGIA